MSDWMISNGTEVLIGEDPPPSGHQRDEKLAVIEISTLSVILVLAVTSNLAMLIAIARQRANRPLSRMYFFMMHLSLADLLVSLFNILPQVINSNWKRKREKKSVFDYCFPAVQLAWDITFRFRGGDLLCRFVKYGQIMTLYLSTYILMFMAIDRYRVRVLPVQIFPSGWFASASLNGILLSRQAVTVRNNLHWNSLKVAKAFVATSWIMALLFAVPQAVIFGEQQVSPDGATDCWVHFIEPWGAKAYVTW